MIPIMSWRNIWRNRTRSFVVIGAIAIGIWAAIFMTSFATGMIQSYVQRSIENEVSHIQIHHPEFTKEYEFKFTLQETDDLSTAMSDDRISDHSVRAVTNAMLSCSKGTRGIRIKAVDPKNEAGVSKIDRKIIDGGYFSDRKNQVLISKRIADKLKLKVRSKLVLTFQDHNYDITAAAFRVAGIYDTGNNPFDDFHVFVNRADFNRLVYPESGQSIAHEVAIVLDDPEQLEEVRSDLASMLQDASVETYREISPDLQLYESQISFVSIIYLTVIMLALIFGIINTMMMAVLERIRELGMLMAIGMNKVRIFFMIVLETILLGVVAAPIGLAIGYTTVKILSKTGINLSFYSESLRMYGMAKIIYPVLHTNVYWQVAIAVALTAVIASLYPALKAIRLRPVEAIHKH